MNLQLAWARKFEPLCICNGESSDIVLFLMSIENPNQKIIDAMQNAVHCNRDSSIVFSLAELERERRAGYSWYTYAPQKVMDKYAACQKKYAADRNVLQKGY